MQVSCFKRKPNMVAGAHGFAPLVGGWYLGFWACERNWKFDELGVGRGLSWIVQFPNNLTLSTSKWGKIQMSTKKINFYDPPLDEGNRVRALKCCRDTYSDTTNVEYTLSCTQPSNILLNGVGEPHLGAGGRRGWPKT